MELAWRRLVPYAAAPERAHHDDAGYDLRASEPATIAPRGGRGAVSTGIAVAIPDGYAGLVLPRSGLARKHGIGLPNAPGLIDAGYRGELTVLLLNTDPDEAFSVEPGDRIAQLVIVRHETPELVERESLEHTLRGENGFGSTGHR